MNLIYIIIIFITTIAYIFNDYNVTAEIEYKYYLTTFKDIKIENFLLPENFHKNRKEEKIKYIMRNVDFYKYTNSQNENHYISLINKLRTENNLQSLKKCENERLPEFVKYSYNDILLNNANNNFYINSRIKYILKYEIGELEKKLENKDNDLISILLKKELNHIILIRQGNIIYININNECICLNENYKKFENKNDKDNSYKLFKNKVDIDDTFYKV